MIWPSDSHGHVYCGLHVEMLWPSYVGTLGPEMVALFGKAVESSGGKVTLEELSH